MRQENKNLNNYSWYLSEIYQIFYVSQGHGFKKETRIIKNPNLKQLWNFYVSHKNIPMLQSMINSHIDNSLINTKNENGDTIIHQIKSIQMYQFAIKNKADFSIDNIDGETGYYYSSYYFISLKAFQLVWKQLSQNQAIQKLKEIPIGVSTFANLCSNDKNLSKLIWLEKHFKISFDKYFEISQYIQYAHNHQSYKNVLFLKKMFALNNQLNYDLNLKKNNPKPLLKI